MFCKNCGKENVSGGDTCEFCGFDFSKSVTAKSTISDSIANKIKIHKKLIVLLISIMIVLAAIFAFYKIGMELTKPERIIKDYITARVNSDYETIYENLDVSDDEFLSKEKFLSCTETAEEIEDIKITSINITVATDDDLNEDVLPLSDSKVDLAYKVVYTTQTDVKSQTEIVYLTKTEKALVFFNKYKVNPNKYIVTNYSIDVPSYAQVTLDGIEIGESYLLEGSKGYVIPKIFSGTHTILITSDYTEDYEEQCEISKYNKENSPTLEVKKTLCDEMAEKTKNTLYTLFEGMTSNKSFEEIELKLDIVKTQKSEIKEFYEAFCNITLTGKSDEGIVYTKREIVDTSEEEKQYYISQINNIDTGIFEWNIEAPLKFNVDYTVAYDYVLENDRYSWGTFSRKRTYNLDVSYALEDGKLKIYSINNTEEN